MLPAHSRGSRWSVRGRALNAHACTARSVGSPASRRGHESRFFALSKNNVEKSRKTDGRTRCGVFSSFVFFPRFAAVSILWSPSSTVLHAPARPCSVRARAPSTARGFSRSGHSAADFSRFFFVCFRDPFFPLPRSTRRHRYMVHYSFRAARFARAPTRVIFFGRRVSRFTARAHS